MEGNNLVKYMDVSYSNDIVSLINNVTGITNEFNKQYNTEFFINANNINDFLMIYVNTSIENNAYNNNLYLKYLTDNVGYTTEKLIFSLDIFLDNKLNNDQDIKLITGEDREYDGTPCSRCKSTNTIVNWVQIRAGDEAMNSILSCTNCGFKRINS